jgi:hypothetical protein
MTPGGTHSSLATDGQRRLSWECDGDDIARQLAKSGSKEST